MKDGLEGRTRNDDEGLREKWRDCGGFASCNWNPAVSGARGSDTDRVWLIPTPLNDSTFYRLLRLETMWTSSVTTSHSQPPSSCADSLSVLNTSNRCLPSRDYKSRQHHVMTALFEKQMTRPTSITNNNQNLSCLIIVSLLMNDFSNYFMSFMSECNINFPHILTLLISFSFNRLNQLNHILLSLFASSHIWEVYTYTLWKTQSNTFMQ